MEPPGTIRIFFLHGPANIGHLGGIGHAGSIGQTDFPDAHFPIGFDDLAHHTDWNFLVPGRSKGHGNGSRNCDSSIFCPFHTGSEAGDAFSGGAIQVGQIMGNGGRNIELHLFAATGDGPLHPFQVGNQGPVFHPWFLIDSLEHCIRICHLGHSFRADEAPHLDDREASSRQPIHIADLLFRGHHFFLILEPIPKPHFTQADLFWIC